MKAWKNLSILFLLMQHKLIWRKISNHCLKSLSVDWQPIMVIILQQCPYQDGENPERARKEEKEEKEEQRENELSAGIAMSNIKIGEEVLNEKKMLHFTNLFLFFIPAGTTDVTLSTQ